jgi:UDP-N-acetylglucosamine:LPS N-acetylglucosamine transferase
MKKKKVDFESAKICIPTSSGGHLTHMIFLKDLWKNNDRFWVTFNKVDAQSVLKDERKYWCHYPTNRNVVNLIKNTFLAIKILRKEKPDLILSSGAAVAIPFFFIGKVFFHCKCVYVEVFDRIDKSTIAGKFCYKFADEFIVQWEEQLKVYPKAKCLGSIF